jgi:hypothetical protein
MRLYFFFAPINDVADASGSKTNTCVCCTIIYTQSILIMICYCSCRKHYVWNNTLILIISVRN